MDDPGKCHACGKTPKEANKKTSVKMNGLFYDIFKCVCGQAVWVCRMEKSDIYYQ